ncbi:hypothetical protein FLK61_38905 [Paenalkalicoccus suaedae]|uniref:Uncharacterized protein n=1 Tax=Paenalkalicoccus suaedae TaxID=2592382 RepID=A0A859FIC5_9BACI|nr:hypothetical protein [Paenalkalicoccus suaedae]QKS72590.1 hypothetical protein FLK61_38905 [Paenalkalicoccus suaedae]
MAIKTPPKVRLSTLTFGGRYREDTYEDGKAAYEKLQKLALVTEDIKELGFSGRNNQEIKVDFIPTHRDENGVSLKTLHLMSNQSMPLGNLQESEITRLQQLIMLIQSSGADISRVYVEDFRTDTTITFDGYASTTALTEDELYTYLRKTNRSIGTFESIKKYEEDFNQTTNERFRFGFDELDHLYTCSEYTEAGTCTGIRLTVRYQYPGLSEDNEHLLADVTAILNLLDNTMQDINSYELFIAEENDEGEWFKEVHFTKQERDQFESVENFIEVKF